jgi:hypothetical protein
MKTMSFLFNSEIRGECLLETTLKSQGNADLLIAAVNSQRERKKERNEGER